MNMNTEPSHSKWFYHRLKQARKYLKKVGGTHAAVTILAMFLGFLWFASCHPDNPHLKHLQNYGSTAQVFALMGTIAIALICKGVLFMIFKFADNKRVQALEKENAELRAKIKRLETGKAPPDATTNPPDATMQSKGSNPPPPDNPNR